MRDSVPNAIYSSVCNVLRLWRILLIPTYRVYRLYDYKNKNTITKIKWGVGMRLSKSIETRGMRILHCEVKSTYIHHKLNFGPLLSV